MTSRMLPWFNTTRDRIPEFRGVRRKPQTRAPRLERLEERTLMTALPYSASGKVQAGIDTSYTFPRQITVGDDGNLWVSTQFGLDAYAASASPGDPSQFIAQVGAAIPGADGLYSPGYGSITKIPTLASDLPNPNPNSYAVDSVIRYPIQDAGGASLHVTGLSLGPVDGINDKMIWFAAGTEIGRIGTDASTYIAGTVINHFALPDGVSASKLALSPDKQKVWFTDAVMNQVGFVDHLGLGGAPIALTGSTAAPAEIVAGPDGNMWVTEPADKEVARVTPSGGVTQYPIPGGESASDITAGPDGGLWMTTGAGNIDRLDAAAGTFTTYTPMPGARNHDVEGLTFTPDGALWFVLTQDQVIARATVPKPASTVVTYAASVLPDDPSVVPNQLWQGPGPEGSNGSTVAIQSGLGPYLHMTVPGNRGANAFYTKPEPKLSASSDVIMQVKVEFHANGQGFTTGNHNLPVFGFFDGSHDLRVQFQGVSDSGATVAQVYATLGGVLHPLGNPITITSPTTDFHTVQLVADQENDTVSLQVDGGPAVQVSALSPLGQANPQGPAPSFFFGIPSSSGSLAGDDTTIDWGELDYGIGGTVFPTNAYGQIPASLQSLGSYTATRFAPEHTGWTDTGFNPTPTPVDHKLQIASVKAGDPSIIYRRAVGQSGDQDAVIQAVFTIGTNADGSLALGAGDAIVFGLGDNSYRPYVQIVRDPNTGGALIQLTDAFGGGLSFGDLADPTSPQSIRFDRQALNTRSTSVDVSVFDPAQNAWVPRATNLLTSGPTAAGAPAGFFFGVDTGSSSAGGTQTTWSYVGYAVGATSLPVPQGVGPAPRGSFTGLIEAKSRPGGRDGPLTVGPNDQLVLDVKAAYPFLKPDHVVLRFADGHTRDLMPDAGAGQPNVANEFTLLYTVNPLNGDLQGAVQATATAVATDGSPMNLNVLDFVIAPSSQTPADRPVLGFSDGSGITQQFGVATLGVDPLVVTTFHVTATSPTGDAVRILPIGLGAPHMKFEDANGNEVTSVESAPGQTADLTVVFKPTLSEQGSTFYPAFAAEDLTTHDTTAITLITGVTGSKTDAAPQLTVIPVPVVASTPGQNASQITFYIASSRPINGVGLEITDNHGQVLTTPIQVRGTDDSGGMHFITTVPFSNSADNRGVYHAVASGQDAARQDALIGVSASVAFYVGTPGELIQQPVFNSPAGRPIRLADGDPVLIRGPGNTIVAGVYSRVAGGLLSRGGGNIVSRGGGSLISEDTSGLIGKGSGTFKAFDVTKLISEDVSGVMPRKYGVLDVADGNTLFASQAVINLLNNGAPQSVTLFDGTQFSVSAPAAAAGVLPVALMVDNQAAKLISEDVSGLISEDTSGLISEDVSGVVQPVEQSLGANGSQIAALAVPGGSGGRSRAAPSGIAATPGGAATDALLYAEFLTEHTQALHSAGQPDADVQARSPYIAAAMNAAATVADGGFAALSPNQLAALRRASSVIAIQIASATSGSPIVPGGAILITPVNPNDALALDSMSLSGGQTAVSLGGSVVTFGGDINTGDPGTPILPVPIHGRTLALVSATPGQVEAVLPGLTTLKDDQIIVLTTADGRLAIGHVIVQPSTGTLQFSSPTYAWGKSGLQAQITVTRTGGSAGVMGATVVPSDGTGKVGIAYEGDSLPVIFGNGDSSAKTVTLTVNNDAAAPVETVNLALGSPFNGATIGAQATAVLTLSSSATIAGTVYHDLKSDGKLDPGDVGVRDVTVFLDTKGTGVLDPSDPTTQTDASGAYAFGNLATGTYTVRAVLTDGVTQTAPASGGQVVILTATGGLSASNDLGIAFRTPATVILHNVPASLTVEATSAAGAVVTFATATASDAADPKPLVTSTPASGSAFPLGTSKVTVTATDNQGNTGTASFSVTVQDTTAPSLVNVPANLALQATNPAGAVVTFVSPTASDAVDPHPSVVCTPASGSTFPVGTTVVTCRATDASGNTRSASFTVTVNLKPTIKPPPPAIDGPIFTAISRSDGRKSSRIILSFNDGLDASHAQDLATYVVTAGGKGVSIVSAVYDAGAHTVTITTKKPLSKTGGLQVRILGTGPHALTDAVGRALDGNHDGHAGSDAVATLAAPSKPGHPKPHPKPHPHPHPHPHGHPKGPHVKGVLVGKR